MPLNAPETSRYSAFVTLWKAAMAFLAVVTGGEAAFYAMPLPEDAEAFRLRWPVYAAAAILALWRAWENVRKQFRLFEYPWTVRGGNLR